MKNKNKQKCPIGIFDSGFGGLHIMKAIVKKLPQYDYVYLGDTARAPYGKKSQEEIYRHTCEAIDFLFSKNCNLIIIACNTVSSKALKKIQKNYLKKHRGKKVLGVLIPAVEEACNITKSKRVGVIATESTVNSEAFIREFLKIDKKIKVFQKACPLFVSIVESGAIDKKKVERVAKLYLNKIIKNKLDTLILGCTHYGFLKRYIKKIAPTDIKLIVEDKIVARKLKKYLLNHPEIEKTISKKKSRKFYTTDLMDKFAKLGSYFYGQKIKPEKINLV